MRIKIKKQKLFPYYRQYKKTFPINADTIFIYKDTIYSDNEIPYDVFAHEVAHLKRQNEIGARKWIKQYLSDDKFRLQEELIAYKVQLMTVRKTGDRQEYAHILAECARNLASPLYGNIISYQKAIKILKQ